MLMLTHEAYSSSIRSSWNAIYRSGDRRLACAIPSSTMNVSQEASHAGVIASGYNVDTRLRTAGAKAPRVTRKARAASIAVSVV